MKNVIQISNNGRIFYHVSHNPNNGELTFTKDIDKASVFESNWDMSFIPKIKEYIMRKYPKSKINIVEWKKKTKN